jgi:phosphate/sulfate permease
MKQEVQEMTIEIAIVVAGIMVFVGSIIVGGIIYDSIEKLTKAINKSN